MYSNVQSLKMYREGENFIWFIKIWLKFLMPLIINCLDNMSGSRYDLERFWFTSWFGTILIYIMIWNGFDLHHDLKRFWFTACFEPILIYIMIWNSFDLQHELERFWFTSWFGTVLIYIIIHRPYIRCSSHWRPRNPSNRIH